MTETSFVQLCEGLSDNLWLQSLLILVGTCFLEDAARCGVGLMVAAGHVGWWLAFLCMTAGGMAGDLGLYLIGRYATLFLLSRRWMDKTRLEWMEGYFKNHAVKTVMLSRFIPGARTVAFGAAGIIRYPMPRFMLLLLIAAVVQSLLYLQLGAFIGARILPYLNDGHTQAGIITVVILAGVLAHHVVNRRRRNKAAADAPETPPAE